MPDKDVIVYSTEHGRMCPKCRQPLADCTCGKQAKKPVGDGKVRVGIESKGRKGKTVTLVSGLSLPEADLEKLTTELKRRCGAGGVLKDWVIELQGDHRDVVIAELLKKGIKSKKVGS